MFKATIPLFQIIKTPSQMKLIPINQKGKYIAWPTYPSKYDSLTIDNIVEDYNKRWKKKLTIEQFYEYFKNQKIYNKIYENIDLIFVRLCIICDRWYFI